MYKTNTIQYQAFLLIALMQFRNQNKIMQWIMVSCCREIMACDVKKSLTAFLTAAKHHPATPGLSLSVYVSFTNQYPFFPTSSARIASYLLMEINENSEIPQQIIRMYA